MSISTRIAGMMLRCVSTAGATPVTSFGSRGSGPHAVGARLQAVPGVAADHVIIRSADAHEAFS
ncbi:hypothetical protein [Haloactinomyces albus]|uniref:Uncharacterized protein n=1 Tax=Haloactinomyces albus TaxID=1352928 RepID=A0AAE3ZCA0_9ACTN|nr:hypothetical protein [Haloactinomyces albus]MDR7300607.1 hypothetical protein [Haloactinomyces albus]